jgi:methionine biosynthesis protein MetW
MLYPTNIFKEIGYDLVINEVEYESRVLDLGCGDGGLLDKLQKIKNVKGFGVEISESGVGECVEKGLYCYQGDIDEGLADYRNNSFDYVIINQTLQSTKRPLYVLKEIMRIGKNAIISFPNFGYINTRLHLLFKGTMPKNKLLPYEWYESPNIHHLTINDFVFLCGRFEYPVKKVMHFNCSTSGSSIPVRILPNLRAQHGFFILDGEKFSL